jgi:hypothetical protein
MNKFWSENAQSITLVAFLSLLSLAGQGWHPYGVPISLYIALGMLVLVFSWSFYLIQIHNRLLILALFIGLIYIAIREFAFVYLTNGITGGPRSASELDCFYFSLYAWTGFGFIDFKPTDATQFWVALEVSIGYVINAALFALFVNVLKPWQFLVKS